MAVGPAGWRNQLKGTLIPLVLLIILASYSSSSHRRSRQKEEKFYNTPLNLVRSFLIQKENMFHFLKESRNLSKQVSVRTENLVHRSGSASFYPLQVKSL